MRLADISPPIAILIALLLAGCPSNAPKENVDTSTKASEHAPPTTATVETSRAPISNAPGSSVKVVSSGNTTRPPTSNASHPTQAEAPQKQVDHRPIGPTTDGCFLVEATDGRKAEMKFTDRHQDGTLVAKLRNGQTFKFPETRLTRESLSKLHDYMTTHSMVSVRLKDIQSHAGKDESSTSGYAGGNHASVGKTTRTLDYVDAKSTHKVILTTTCPFERDVMVESFYTDASGESFYSRRKQKYTVSMSNPLEFEISAKADGVSILQPTIVVRDIDGNVLDFDTKNPRFVNRYR